MNGCVLIVSLVGSLFLVGLWRWGTRGHGAAGLRVWLVLLAFVIASNAYGHCDLTVGPGLNLGPPDGTRLKSTGEVKMAFLFIDFPDAPANEDAQGLYDALVPFARDWVSEVSNGRTTLAVTPVFQWFLTPSVGGILGDTRCNGHFEVEKSSSFVRVWDEVAEQAEREGWGFERYLHQLAEIEVEERRVRRIERLRKRS